MSMRPLALALASVLALTSVAPAFAQGGIEQQYKASLKLEKEGDLVGALAGFEAIPEAKRDFNTRFHIAGLKEKLGRLLEAERDYETIRTDPKADSPSVESAAGALQDLRPRIPKLVVKLTTATSGVNVTIDGHDTKVPVTVNVNPGTHSVVATRGTDQVFRRDVTMAESTTIEVFVDAPAPAAPPVVAPAASPSASPSGMADTSPSNSSQKTWGYVAIGAGAAFAVLGGVAYLQTRSAITDYNDTCNDKTCTGDFDAANSKKNTWGAISYVGLAGAVIGVGVGITLLVTAPKTETGVTVKASAGKVNGFVLEGRF